MKTYRILFTGVGRRVELVQAFRQAASVLHKQLKIYGADLAGTAPALAFCDYVRTICAMKDESYIEELVTICENDRIDLLIPTIDTDLLILSQNVDLFGKTRVLISSFDVVSLCRDKSVTAGFFASCGLQTPETVNRLTDYTGSFPCFIKPKDGSSSINAFKINNMNELKMFSHIIEDYIIQPFVSGMEYTVDIFCDFDGKPVYITPRKRLLIRAGEVLKTEIDLDGQIIDECRKIVQKLKPCGPLTVQLIRDRKGNDNYIEINPRFGGGAPLSMKAGARSAESILQLLAGEKVCFNQIDDGAIYSRFDQSVCMEEGRRRQQIKGVVFDLDDTLFSETQYVRSGYEAVGRYLEEPDAAERLWSLFKEGKMAIDCYLKEIGKSDRKDACLEVYRLHKPQINLYDGVAELIEELKDRGVKVGIITDGRPEGQRNKIEALGLIVDDVIITDELGGIQFRKPNTVAFRLIRDRWEIPYESMVYVGNDAAKDFQAPMQLGMRCLYFENPDSLYHSIVSMKSVSDIKSIRKVITDV